MTSLSLDNNVGAALQVAPVTAKTNPDRLVIGAGISYRCCDALNLMASHLPAMTEPAATG